MKYRFLILFLLFPQLIYSIDLKAMSFNIKNGNNKDSWDNRKNQVWGVIEKYDPDVVGLQEAFRYQLDDMMAELSEYTELGVGRKDGKEDGEYASILFKKDTYDVDTTDTFWLSHSPEVPGSKFPGTEHPRIVTWARLIQKTTNFSFYFYSSHWSHMSNEARIFSAGLIADRVANRPHPLDPAVYVCDCNSNINNAPMKILTGENQNSPVDLISTWHHLYPDEKEARTGHGFSGRTDGSPIDYIMVDDQTAIVEVQILHDHIGDVYPSDHFPITADLSFDWTSVNLLRPRNKANNINLYIISSNTELTNHWNRIDIFEQYNLSGKRIQINSTQLGNQYPTKKKTEILIIKSLIKNSGVNND